MDGEHRLRRSRLGSLRFRRGNGERFGSHLGGGVLYGQAWPAYQIHEGVFRSCNSYPAVEEEEEEEEILGLQGEGGLLPSSFNDPVSLVFAARVLHRVGEGGRGINWLTRRHSLAL